MPGSSGPQERGSQAADAVEALQAATRMLAGVALHSLDALDGAVTLPQFRMLAVLAEAGPARSSRVAEALGLEPSTVSRLADRLVAAGHVVRGSDPGHRGVVTLALTASGRRIVRRVAAARQEDLAKIAGRLDEGDRERLTAALRQLVSVVGDGYGTAAGGPIPM